MELEVPLTRTRAIAGVEGIARGGHLELQAKDWGFCL
jgi:hypothetical protein